MTTKKKHNSALSISNGVVPSESAGDEAVRKFKDKRRKKYSVEEYVDGIRNGNITILSQAITLIESSLHSDYKQTQEILDACMPYTGNSIRIGITGVPGVGKSSFIETFGKYLTGKGNKIAVLAIDPSSERSKGSIMGDKTRMEELASDNNAFIRPSPSAGSLGGVAQKTRETIFLCEAAGYNIILIETVGVGQSETAVHSMVDFFLLLMLAGAGDELQGIKRGIMEMADLIAITKADGNNLEKANRAKADFSNALHLFPSPDSGWIPRVLTCSALYKKGIDEIWDSVCDYTNFTKSNKYFGNRRKIQSKYWLHETIMDRLKKSFYGNQVITESLLKVEKDVVEGKLSSYVAADKLLRKYFKSMMK